MKAKRDEFRERTKRLLAQRVGTLCSNPGCGGLTFGPNASPDKRTCIGVAAHITAAQEGGPRFDALLSSDQRRHFDNGIWLCRSCSDLVDSDENYYTPDLLREWKAQAEKRARDALENPRLVNLAPKNGAEPILFVTRQTAFVPFTPPPAPEGMVPRIGLTLKPVIAPHAVKPNMLAIHGRNQHIPKGFCFVTVHLQNIGSAVATNVRAIIRVKGSSLVFDEITQPNRMSLIGGGKKGSTFIDLVVPTLLANETQTATLAVKDGAELKLELLNESGNLSKEIYLFDWILGDVEFVPRQESPFGRKDTACG